MILSTLFWEFQENFLKILFKIHFISIVGKNVNLLENLLSSWSIMQNCNVVGQIAFEIKFVKNKKTPGEKLCVSRQMSIRIFILFSFSKPHPWTLNRHCELPCIVNINVHWVPLLMVTVNRNNSCPNYWTRVRNEVRKDKNISWHFSRPLNLKNSVELLFLMYLFCFVLQ